MASNKLLF